jgi:hypothetical protein
MAILTTGIPIIFIFIYFTKSQFILVLEHLFYLRIFTSLSGKQFNYAFIHNKQVLVFQLIQCLAIALNY